MQGRISTLKMSFGSAIFVALFFVSYISGITSTIHGCTQYATDSLADVTHLCRFGFAVRASNPGWYRDGMQLFAFNHLEKRWNKRDISWGIERDSETIDRQVVVNAATEAFNKWSAVTQLRFNGPVEQPEIPDIRITFERFQPNGTPEGGVHACRSRFLTDGNILDDYGTRITINDGANWTRRPARDWFNIKFMLLHEIGHSLGLDHSNVDSAVMCYDHRGIHRRSTRPLHSDDILGIQDLYGLPRWESQVRPSVESNSNRDRI